MDIIASVILKCVKKQHYFLFLQTAATSDWYALSLWSFCFFLSFDFLSLNLYDAQLQNRRIEAEQTETALWHWSLNLQAKVMPDRTRLIIVSSALLQLHKKLDLYIFRCSACGGSGLQSVRGSRSVWLWQLSFIEMNCCERASHTSSHTQRTWVLSPLILPSTAMNRCCLPSWFFSYLCSSIYSL